MAEVDIVVVGYRSEEFLERLWDDIGTLSAYSNTIFYTDNTGNPNSLAAAWNALAAMGQSRFLAVLNPDIALCPEWDRKMVSALLSNPEIGIVTANPVFVSHPAPSREKMAEIAGQFESGPLLTSESIQFFCVLMERETWASLRGVDERMRFYMQDIDFIVRAKERLSKTAMRVLTCPVWHHGSASTKEASKHNEIDPQKECDFGSLIFSQVRRGELKSWEMLSEDERSAIRQDSRFWIPKRESDSRE